MKVRLLHGWTHEVLSDLPENYFDACPTDPPYGLKFMGKKWDHGVPTVRDWEAIYRVMKPGAHVLSFSGTRTYHRMVCALEDAGFEVRDMMAWMYGQGFPKSHNLDDRLGTALKPAFEPIVIARKPLEGTVEENYAKWGTGVLNIGECRVPLDGDYKSKANGRPSQTGLDDRYDSTKANQQDDKGRWPANIMHDGSDEVLGVFPNQKSGAMKKAYEYTNTGHSLGKPAGATRQIHDANEGSAARFFYCGKASRADRNEGCEELEAKPLAYGNQAQAEVKRGNLEHSGNSGMNTVKMMGNHWPTVKPTNVMRYLIRLITPDKGRILDPFMGSGSTGKAAAWEFCEEFVGIDQDAEAIAIAQARIDHALRNRDGQMNIF